MQERSHELWNSINLIERFERISLSYQDEPMMTYSNSIIADILKRTDVHFNYSKKENFYSLTEIEGDYDARLNLSFKYGIVEPILWAKNIKTGEQFGGVLSRQIKLIQKHNRATENSRIPYPRFSKYEELEQIVIQLHCIFIDFKQALQNLNGKFKSREGHENDHFKITEIMSAMGSGCVKTQQYKVLE